MSGQSGIGYRPTCNKNNAMSPIGRLLAAVILIVPLAAHGDEGDFPIKADDGAIIANHRISADIERQIEKLPGIVVVGNPNGAVTLAEFYDLNCPYCRKASADIAALVNANRELRLVLVPFPVLGIPSIQAGRVELAVAQLATPEKFYEFHRKVYAGRGVIDGNRAFAAAEAIGLDVKKVEEIANDDSLTKVMIAHLRVGDALKIEATPGFVIKGVAIVGYPGPKALADVIHAVQQCGKVICDGATR
jgi:protein-disulfide isomerase